jgi:AAA domain-containing protein
MTHRERHTPEEAPARDGPRTPPVRPSASVSSTGTTPSAPRDGSLWMDWYHRASPAQQQEAVLRAIHQGIVYAHQLAAPAPSTAAPRSLLSSLLNGQVKELAPLRPPALEFHDGQLDRTQREAVARAVATPDVCLIQGMPGTGKSRLLVEILLQAAGRGERILFLAPTTAALDNVLERLAHHPAVCPIRCLAAEEKPADLPPAIARLTLPERLRHYRETTLPAARAARDAALQTLHAGGREQASWPRLETVAEQHEQLTERLRILVERRDEVAAEVQRQEPNAVFGERWRSCDRARKEAVDSVEGQLAGLQAELETILAKQTQLDNEWEKIRPLAEARQGHRLWTGTWWRALLRSGLKQQVQEVEARRAELGQARQRLGHELARRRNEQDEIEGRFAAECRRLQDEEIARRRAELDNEITALTREQNSLREQWRNLCATLPSEAVPVETSRLAVTASRAAWERLREQDAQRAAAAEQWLQTVEEGVQTLPEKLAGCANVIAATTATLSGDTASRLPPVFDLLILDQTHQVTEPEFAGVARRARRWVLVGEPQHIVPGLPGRRYPPGKPGAICLFHRLWQNLHADPCGLPFAWVRRGDRLLCRLRPIAAGHEKWIETEPVVDRPDIELRILSIPRQPPRIVEVLFPDCMDLSAAKQFILHELEELAVQTFGRGLCWFETAEQVVLEFAPSADAETRTIALETGVCERITRLPADSGVDWHTCSLEFVRATGWTRERAEEWIAERLGLRWPGRTVLLTASYRLDSLAPPSNSCPPCQKRTTTEHTEHTEKRQRKKQKKI